MARKKCQVIHPTRFRDPTGRVVGSPARSFLKVDERLPGNDKVARKKLIFRVKPDRSLSILLINYEKE